MSAANDNLQFSVPPCSSRGNLAGVGFGPRSFIQRAQDPQQGEHVLWIISAHVGPFHFFPDQSDSSLNPAFGLSRALVSSPRAADPVGVQALPPSALPSIHGSHRTMDGIADVQKAFARDANV